MTETISKGHQPRRTSTGEVSGWLLRLVAASTPNLTGEGFQGRTAGGVWPPVTGVCLNWSQVLPSPAQVLCGECLSPLGRVASVRVLPSGGASGTRLLGPGGYPIGACRHTYRISPKMRPNQKIRPSMSFQLARNVSPIPNISASEDRQPDMTEYV